MARERDGGEPGLAGDHADREDARDEPGDGAEEGGETRLGEREQRGLAARRAVVLEAPALGLDVPAEPGGGEHREREHERGGLAADEQDPPGRRLPAALGRHELVGRRHDPEGGVLELEGALCLRDLREHRARVPDVDRARAQRDRPRVAAEERRQRRQRCQRVDAGRHHDGHGRHARLVGQHVPERQRRGERAAPDDAQVDARGVEPRRQMPREGDHLAAHGRTGARQPARAQVQDAVERVDGGDLHEAAVQGQRAERDRARGGAAERPERCLRGAVEALEAGAGRRARPADADRALGRRKRRDGALQRTVARGEAAAGEPRDEGAGDRDPRSHDQPAAWAGASPAQHQPCDRDESSDTSPHASTVHGGGARCAWPRVPGLKRNPCSTFRVARR